MTTYAQAIPKVTKPTAQEWQERMLTYLQATRPSFELAVVKFQTLGQVANGVLAGPIAKK